MCFLGIKVFVNGPGLINKDMRNVLIFIISKKCILGKFQEMSM